MRAEVAAIEHLSGHGGRHAPAGSRRASPSTPSSGTRRRGVAATRSTAGRAGVTGQMVEQVRQTLRDVAAPFPEEEVGPGARWQKLSQLASRDARVTQTEVFTLTQLTATTGALDDVLAQTAPPQPLLSPGGRRRRRLASSRCWRRATERRSSTSTRLVPQTKFAGTTTMVVSSRSGDEDDRRMTMIMRVEIALAGTAR